MRSALARHNGEPVEIHELDDKTARKISRKLIGRVLTEREARAARVRKSKRATARRAKGVGAIFGALRLRCASGVKKLHLSETA